MTTLYNLCLILVLVYKLVCSLFVRGSFCKNLFIRFKRKEPTLSKKGGVIWLHAASMGETKALSTLVPPIRKTYPDAFILVSTMTKTGQKEAKRLITKADAFCYLPLDLSWIMRPFVKRVRPRLLILIEGEFWYHLLKEVKKQGGSVALVNGKISKRSLKYYLLFRPFARALFEKVDLFCVQNQEYLERFLNLGIDPGRLTVMSHLKYDIQSVKPSDLELQLWKKRLSLQDQDFILTAGSTHQGEEAFLLKVLKSLWDQYENLKLLIVPRHPERFSKVKKLIEESCIPYSIYSSVNPQKGANRLILIDAMGVLPTCYHSSDLTIVGGSFFPGVGGHDVFEPVGMGKPVLFGPYIEHQKEFAKPLLQSGVARKVPIQELSLTLEKYLSNPALVREEQKKAKEFAGSLRGSSFKSWQQVRRLLDPPLH